MPTPRQIARPGRSLGPADAERNRALDQHRGRARHRGLHVAGAGPRRRTGPQKRSVLTGRGALRDGHRDGSPSAAEPRRWYSRPSSTARRCPRAAVESRADSGHWLDHLQAAGKRPEVTLPVRRRTSGRPQTGQAGHRILRSAHLRGAEEFDDPLAQTGIIAAAARLVLLLAICPASAQSAGSIAGRRIGPHSCHRRSALRERGRRPQHRVSRRRRYRRNYQQPFARARNCG